MEGVLWGREKERVWGLEDLLNFAELSWTSLPKYLNYSSISKLSPCVYVVWVNWFICWIQPETLLQRWDDGPGLRGSSGLFEEDFRESRLNIFSLTPLCSSLAEEILDDGVGLILETSGDSLDDDSEIFSESDDFGKVRNSKHVTTFAVTRKDRCTHHRI